jgi:hypothetical protein
MHPSNAAQEATQCLVRTFADAMLCFKRLSMVDMPIYNKFRVLAIR